MKDIKEMNLEGLAEIMKRGFARAEERTDEKIEELAGMVNRNFNRMEKRFDRVNQSFGKLEKEVADIGHKVNQIDKRLFSLEEDIYKTKREQFERLDGRVTLVEKKLGIQNAR